MFRFLRIAGLAAFSMFAFAGVASAQTLTVLPVTVHFGAGQMANTVTVVNQGDSDVSYQIRVFSWAQNDEEKLTPTNELVVSPPLGSIPASASQVIRLALRHAPAGGEATYRILIDQIPPPAEPNTVRIALRLSLPVFAEPKTRVAPRVQWRVEKSGGQTYLVARNEGSSHEVARNISLTAADGAKFAVDANASPYILAGATRRWLINVQGTQPAQGAEIHLTAAGDTGAIDQKIQVTTQN